MYTDSIGNQYQHALCKHVHVYHINLEREKERQRLSNSLFQKDNKSCCKYMESK